MDKILSELSSSLKQNLKVKIPTHLPSNPYLIHKATDNEEWFCGRDVCLILRFQNIGDALTKKVKKAYKTSLHAICETHMTPASNNEGRAVDK